MNTLDIRRLTRFVPPEPRSIEDTGLPLAFLADLALKIMYVRGYVTGLDIADEMKLPFASVVDRALDYLRRERLAEVKGAASFGESNYQYVISDQGRARARELMSDNTYAGPAPVPLNAYNHAAMLQSISEQTVPPTRMREALKHLVISENLMVQIGPAINSGKSIFLYGNPGNGKTAIAESIGNMLAGNVYVPHAISSDNHIIKVYDAVNHRTLGDNAEGAPQRGERYDRRWVLVRRPMIVTGGELVLESLDLTYDETNRYYEAPHQLKANGGVLLIDDFGRQQVRPRDLLNRWILPLEKRVDFLTLATGRKIELPFDTLVVFSTNMNPDELVDEAFLRRIRYKILVPNPTWEEFREIFIRACRSRGLDYNDEILKYLIVGNYLRPKRPPRAVHPRDILDELVDIARFKGVTPVLSKELLDQATRSYFLKQ